MYYNFIYLLFILILFLGKKYGLLNNYFFLTYIQFAFELSTLFLQIRVWNIRFPSQALRAKLNLY